jgi:hypothetical protein
MLASALDSHPEIQCKGEFGFKDYHEVLGATPKKIKGCITHLKAHQMRHVSLDDVSKIIILARHGNAEQLERMAAGRDFITVTYESITRSRNIRTVPFRIGDRLCDHLGVKHEPLRTIFTKGRGLDDGRK